MDLKELKLALVEHYSATGQEIWLADNQLILRPCDDVWSSMISRNSTVVSEIKKINSSTALAVNYFELFASQSGFRVDYELDVAVPLILPKGKGHPAMLDAYYEKEGTKYYIESKFLEPYYSRTHEISPSYMVERYYENEDVAEKWIDLFKKVQEKIDNEIFKYYDINQMLKHLLAIFRTHPQGPVVLKNLIWKPTECFFEAVKSGSGSSLRERTDILTEEMALAGELMNAFVVEKLHWDDCSVEIGFYNDELDEVSAHKEFATFKKKYLL